MLLSQFCEKYIKDRVFLAASSQHQLRVAARLLDRSQSKRTTTKQLSQDLLKSFAAWLRVEGREARTINGRIKTIETLWRAAHEAGLAAPPPTRSQQVRAKELKRLPNAWTLAQLGRLIQAAQLRRGNVAGYSLDQSWYWQTLLLFAYETGARLSAVLEVKPSDVDLLSRTVRLRAEESKTGLEQIVPLSPQLIELLSRAAHVKREKVFPSCRWRTTLYVQFRKLLVAAGLPTGRKNYFHCLRRTCASHLAHVAGIQAAQQQLGHTSAKQTLAYLDPRITQASRWHAVPMPGGLFDTERE
jgi:integrase